MTRVNVRTLKDRLSEYLDRASRGESVEVTRHDKPVAWLVPADTKAAEVERKFRELVAQGTIILPKNPGRRPKRRPLKIPGSKSVSEMVLEDRRSRY